MSYVCDGRIVGVIIDDTGSTVTVREVSKTLSERYGDASETYTDHTGKKAITWVLSQNDKYVQEGIFNDGTIIFIFDNSNEAILNRGNRILYDSKWYEITDLKKRDMADVTYQIECISKVI